MATATQRAEQQGTRGAGAEGGRCTTRGIGALDGVCGASTPLGLLPQRQPHRRWPANSQQGGALGCVARSLAAVRLAEFVGGGLAQTYVFSPPPQKNTHLKMHREPTSLGFAR